MSTNITLDEAQANLRELVGRLGPGDELVITENHLPVAKLVAAALPRRKLGTLRGSVLYMAPDFDATMDLLTATA